jgi:hypothetical protein
MSSPSAKPAARPNRTIATATQNSQAARSTTVRCARAGACCASTGCFPVRRREHHRRIPDESRHDHLQHRFQRVPPAPLDTLGQTAPTAHSGPPCRLFSTYVERVFRPQTGPRTVHPGRCKYCRREDRTQTRRFNAHSRNRLRSGLVQRIFSEAQTARTSCQCRPGAPSALR